MTLSDADDRKPHPAHSRKIQKINPSENLSSRRALRNCAELRLYPEWCYHKNALFDSINCECEYCALTQVVDFEGKTCLCNVTIDEGVKMCYEHYSNDFDTENCNCITPDETFYE